MRRCGEQNGSEDGEGEQKEPCGDEIRSAGGIWRQRQLKQAAKDIPAVKMACGKEVEGRDEQVYPRRGKQRR